MSKPNRLWCKPGVRLDIVTVKRRWTKARRLRMAEARDNDGPWYVAKSKRSPRDLERLFRLREVAGLLEETIGGILGTHKLYREGYIYIQIARSPESVMNFIRVTLGELGVEIVGAVARSQMNEE